MNHKKDQMQKMHLAELSLSSVVIVMIWGNFTRSGVIYHRLQAIICRLHETHLPEVTFLLY